LADGAAGVVVVAVTALQAVDIIAAAVIGVTGPETTGALAVAWDGFAGLTDSDHAGVSEGAQAAVFAGGSVVEPVTARGLDTHGPAVLRIGRGGRGVDIGADEGVLHDLGAHAVLNIGHGDRVCLGCIPHIGRTHSIGWGLPIHGVVERGPRVGVLSARCGLSVDRWRGAHIGWRRLIYFKIRGGPSVLRDRWGRFLATCAEGQGDKE
jgi:hypothetical protein